MVACSQYRNAYQYGASTRCNAPLDYAFIRNVNVGFAILKNTSAPSCMLLKTIMMKKLQDLGSNLKLIRKMSSKKAKNTRSDRTWSKVHLLKSEAIELEI